MKMENIEKRYKEILSILNISKSDRKKYGVVYTPDWLVDKMIEQASLSLIKANKTLDLCAGMGQFTMGMIRFLSKNKPNFDLNNFLNNHYFVEIQKSVIEKLKYIFGENINIFGDAMKLDKTPLYFDLAFSNPPYTHGIDLKIMTVVNEITNEMVIVHPSTWLIDLKGKRKLFNDIKDLFRHTLRSATLFNGNPVFGIGLFVPCIIAHIDKKKDPKESIKVDYFGDKFEVNDINDVTNFGSNWENIVKPFFEKMKKIVTETGSVWDHNIKETIDGKYYCQLAAIIGDTAYRGDQRGPSTIVGPFSLIKIVMETKTFVIKLQRFQFCINLRKMLNLIIL